MTGSNDTKFDFHHIRQYSHQRTQRAEARKGGVVDSAVEVADQEAPAPISDRKPANYLRDDFIICGTTAILVLVFAVVLATRGINGVRPASIIHNAILYGAGAFAILTVSILRYLAVHRPEHPIGPLLRYLRHSFVPRPLLSTVPILAPLLIFMPTFSAMKSSIPLFQPYSWDASFIQLDRLLHGTDPWRILQPIIGVPFVTSAISVAYHVWLLLIYIGCCYFAIWEPDGSLRRRFFVTFFGIWTICGVLLAFCFASVGPCFVGPMLGNPDFAPLMQYLHYANGHYPVMVLDVQQDLLDWHLKHDHGLGRGISAMPSMHVALAFLFFLAMRHKSRLAGWIFGLFFAVILIGSVHLAYHYAVDGYLAIIVTAAIWKLAGLWKDHAQDQAKPQRHPGLAPG